MYPTLAFGGLYILIPVLMPCVEVGAEGNRHGAYRWTFTVCVCVVLEYASGEITAFGSLSKGAEEQLCDSRLGDGYYR